MSEVGERAGVSAQSVSRFFTGKGYVSDETRQRIAAAIEELGYRRNQAARTLRAKRSEMVGVLCLGPLNYGNAEIVSGLSAEAQEQGFTLIVTQLEVDRDRPATMTAAEYAIERFLALHVDAIILTTPFPGTDALLDRVPEDLPVMVMAARAQDTSDDAAGTATATADSYSAGFQATRHLLRLGHRRILHLAGPPQSNETHERERGYRDALAEVAVAALDVVPQPDWTANGGYLAGLKVDPTTFTAVFAANDEIALGFMSAMRERGLSAPLDYSIIGVDDMPEAAFFAPPLTTMRLDFHSLGRRTLQLVLSQVRTGEPVSGVTFDAVFIERESTRAVDGLPG